MADFTTVKRLAARIGAEFENSTTAKVWALRVTAPTGTIWDANGCHILVGEQPRGPVQWRHDMVADLLQRMEMGYSTCDDPDCEYCHPEE